MLDLDVYESEVHDGCGQHGSIAGTRDLRLERVFCQDCADIEKAIRIQAEADKAADKAKYGENDPPPSARLAGDGQRWTMRVLTAEDKAAEASTEPQQPARGRRRRAGRTRSTR